MKYLGPLRIAYIKAETQLNQVKSQRLTNSKKQLIHARQVYKDAKRKFLKAKYPGMTFKQVKMVQKLEPKIMHFIKTNCHYDMQDTSIIDWMNNLALEADTPFFMIKEQAKKSWRSLYTEFFSWTILDWSWIIILAQIIKTCPGTIIDWGAGMGWLSFMLNATLNTLESDKQVIPYDIAQKDTNKYFKTSGIQAPIDIVTEPVSLDNCSMIICCWPPYGTDMAINILNEAIQNGVKYFVYIGESYDGCNGTYEFHDLLAKYSHTNIPGHRHWWGIYDCAYLYDLTKIAE